MKPIVKRALSTALLLAGMGTITYSETHLRDYKDPPVAPGGYIIHDAGGHTRDEVLVDGLGFVAFIVGGSFLIL